MEFTEFKKVFGKPIFGEHHDLIAIIQKYVTEQDIVVFYPKNLMLEDSSLEIIIFSKSDVWFFTKEENTIEVKVIKDFKVKKMKVIEPTGHLYHLKLEVEFTTGDKLYLNSDEDTNDNWKETFSLYIRDLIHFLK